MRAHIGGVHERSEARILIPAHGQQGAMHEWPHGPGAHNMRAPWATLEACGGLPIHTCYFKALLSWHLVVQLMYAYHHVETEGNHARRRTHACSAKMNLPYDAHQGLLPPTNIKCSF